MRGKRKMPGATGRLDGQREPEERNGASGTTERTRRRRDRSEIVAAAAIVFQRKGYADATIEDIAAELGLLKGSLYHYARSKEELLYAVVEEPVMRMAARLEEIVKTKASADRRLALFIRMHLESLLENYPNLFVYLQEKFDAEEPAAVIRKLRRRYQALVEQMILDGVREGVFRKDVNSRYVAFALLGSLNWTYTWLRPAGGHTVDAIADAVTAMTLEGIVCARARGTNKIHRRRDR